MKSKAALKLLACTLAFGYIGLVIYVSLVPFEGWNFSELKQTPPFWKRSLDTYWTFSDPLFNIVAYIPVSVLIFFALSGHTPWLRGLIALCLASGLSFGMEYLQQAIPSRVASRFDWLMNSLGALIGLWCVRKARHNTWLLPTIIRIYSRLFYLAPSYVAGQAVLGLWALAHINPAIPPFGLIYQRAIPSGDIIRVWIETIQLAFECVGCGLFFSLLLQPCRFSQLGTLLFLLGMIVFKYLGASVLFHAGSSVIYPHQWLGLCIGSAWLIILLWLPPFRRRIAAGVAIVSSIGVTFLGKDLLRTDIPFDLFNWSYGQLTHFNQVTYTTIWATTTWMIIHLAMLHDTTPLPEPHSNEAV